MGHAWEVGTLNPNSQSSFLNRVNISTASITIGITITITVITRVLPNPRPRICCSPHFPLIVLCLVIGFIGCFAGGLDYHIIQVLLLLLLLLR